MPPAIGLVSLVGSALAAALGFGVGVRRSRRHRDFLDVQNRELRRLAMIAEYTTNLVFVTDRIGRITWVNESFVRITGYTLDEVRGLKPWSFLQESGTDPAVVARIQEGLRRGETVRGEVLNYGKDGREHTFLIEIAPLRDELGALTGFMAVETDITTRLQAEAELREVSERLQLATRARGVGTWDYNVPAKSITWDDQMFRLYGITRDQFGGTYEAWRAGVHPSDRSRCDEEIQQALRGEKDFDTEFRVLWPDGAIRFIRGIATVQRDSSGRPVGMVGTNWDVTEQKHSEAKIRDAEQFLRSAVDALDAHTVIVDSDSTVLSDNRAWREFASANSVPEQQGYEGANYLAVCDKAAATSPEAARVAESLRSVLAGASEPPPVEYPCHAPNQRRWFLCSIRGFTRAGKRFAVISHLNITAVKEAEAELVKARDAAETANKAKSAFLANMSHEIRTPLTAILGFADLLCEEGKVTLSPGQRTQTIDTIRNAGTHLLTIINDILDLSKIEADKMIVERTKTSLVAVLREVESLMRPQANGKGLELSTALVTPVPEHILSDPTRLRQILMNLAGNAVKFTEAGRVTVTVSATEQGEKPELVIDVEDTGAGLSKEQAGRLFQIFAQADESMTRRFGGAGLGLTICRRLARLMGGDTTLLRTEPGKGSCFRLVLPLEAVPGAAMVTRLEEVTPHNATAASGAGVRLSGRILLAEDGVDNQRLIAFHLKKGGAQVAVADNGKIALEVLDKAEAEGKPYDLLLTDMQMPEMDGYTLARTLRSRGSRIAIVALTAHAMAEDQAKCIEAGCDGYANKPIDRCKLLEICAKWIGREGGVVPLSMSA